MHHWEFYWKDLVFRGRKERFQFLWGFPFGVKASEYFPLPKTRGVYFWEKADFRRNFFTGEFGVFEEFMGLSPRGGRGKKKKGPLRFLQPGEFTPFIYPFTGGSQGSLLGRKARDTRGVEINISGGGHEEIFPAQKFGTAPG